MTGMHDTFKYHLIVNGSVVHVGITNDLNRRLQEHQQQFGANARIVQQGPPTTRKAALEWENEQRRLGMPTGP